MDNYKEMYLHLMRQTEKAVRILTEAQQACEEMYLEAGDQAAEKQARKQSSLCVVFTMNYAKS